MPSLILTKMSHWWGQGKKWAPLFLSTVTKYSLQMLKRNWKSVLSLGGTRPVFSPLPHIRITWVAYKKNTSSQAPPWTRKSKSLGPWHWRCYKPSNSHVHQGWAPLTNSFSTPVWLFASSDPGLTDWRGLHMRNTLDWEYFKVEVTEQQETRPERCLALHISPKAVMQWSWVFFLLLSFFIRWMTKAKNTVVIFFLLSLKERNLLT